MPPRYKRKRRSDDEDSTGLGIDAELAEVQQEEPEIQSLDALPRHEVEHLPLTVEIPGLLTSARHYAFESPLRYVKKLKGFAFAVAPGICLPGLTKGLRAAFFPDFDFDKLKDTIRKRLARLKAKGKVRPLQQVQSLLDDKTQKRVSLTKATEKVKMGFEGGVFLDQQASAVINNRQDDIPGTLEYAVPPEEQKVLSVAPWNLRPDSMRRLHPGTRAYLMLMTQCHCLPVAAQIQAWHRDIGRATSVEHIWIDVETAQLVLVELKLIDSNTYGEHHAHLHPPYQNQINSKHNQDLLELGFEKWMLEFTYQIGIHQALLVTVDRLLTARAEPLPAWVEEGIPAAAPVLASHWVTIKPPSTQPLVAVSSSSPAAANRNADGGEELAGEGEGAAGPMAGEWVASSSMGGQDGEVDRGDEEDEGESDALDL